MTTTTLTLTAASAAAPAVRDVAAVVRYAKTLGFDVDVPAIDTDSRGRLVLTVREDEPVTVGDAHVTVVGLGARKARLLFEAPRSTAISRHNTTAQAA